MSEITIGLIGGSGLGDALGANGGTAHDIVTPFGHPADSIYETQIAGLRVLILRRHGPAHLYNPTFVPYRANIFALKKLGCTHILASGAVGSLRDEIRPRDLVICDQIIDKTTRRAGTFFEQAAVHVEFADPFCPILRKFLIEAASSAQNRGQETAATETNKIHDRGCYVCMEGPAFSTRSESLMHRLWGGDVIGMTAMPEAKLAREAEIPYALIGLATDYDCWRMKPAVAPDRGQETAATGSELLKEILGHLKAAADSGILLITKTLELIASKKQELESCPARRALELAIWSQKTQIPHDEVQRLAPLWMKYFAENP